MNTRASVPVCKKIPVCKTLGQQRSLGTGQVQGLGRVSGRASALEAVPTNKLDSSANEGGAFSPSFAPAKRRASPLRLTVRDANDY